MTRNRAVSRGLLVLLLGSTLCLAPLPATAGDEQPEHVARSGLMGIGAALSTLVYAPLKLTYAITGVVVAGMGWAWSGGDSDVASTIFNRSVRGSYVVQPDHMTGARSLIVLGRHY